MSRRRIRRLSLVAALATAALALSACTGAGSPGPEPKPTATGEPDPDASLAIGLVLEPTNLDIRHTSGAALEQILIDNIYEGLVTRSEDNKIEPRLASDYEVSADGLTYTFTLNEGITFHSGTALTSADVVSSFEAVRTDPAIQGNADFAGVATITAPDAATVQIVLTKPNQNFLFALTGPAGLVFQTGDTTDLKGAANGTGPFTLTRWNKGSSITFARNDAYWGEKAGVAEVEFQYIDDFTAGVHNALDGGVQVLTAVQPDLASEFDDSDFRLTKGRTTDKGTLAFNNKKAPLDDVRVREALRLAIDHEGLIAARGGGVVEYGPIPELDPGYQDLSDVVTYDPERAKELLADAGQEDLELTLTIPSFYGTTVPKLLISDFAKVGVTLEVKSVEFPTWLEDVYQNHDYDLSFVLHVEPRDLGNFANPDYYFGYDNPEVQRLYDEALAEVDEKKSEKLLAEAARQISEDHAADWLYNDETLTAVAPTVKGFPKESINSRIDLSGVTVLAEKKTKK